MTRQYAAATLVSLAFTLGLIAFGALCLFLVQAFKAWRMERQHRLRFARDSRRSAAP